MARYDPKRKLERNAQVWDYVEAHPELALREVGLVFGVTRARIWQILQAEKKRRETVAPHP